MLSSCVAAVCVRTGWPESLDTSCDMPVHTANQLQLQYGNLYLECLGIKVPTLFYNNNINNNNNILFTANGLSPGGSDYFTRIS
jgi:hypothetical protein